MNEVWHRACSVWEYRSYHYIACCEWCCMQMLSSHARSCWLVWEVGWGHIRGLRKDGWSGFGGWRGCAVGSGPVETPWDAMRAAEGTRWYVRDISAVQTDSLSLCLCVHSAVYYIHNTKTLLSSLSSWSWQVWGERWGWIWRECAVGSGPVETTWDLIFLAGEGLSSSSSSGIIPVMVSLGCCRGAGTGDMERSCVCDPVWNCLFLLLFQCQQHTGIYQYVV